MIGAGAGLLGLASVTGTTLAHKLEYDYHAGAEHFADIQACKKLIESEQFLPILVNLTMLKILEYSSVQKTSCNHPLVTDEFQAIKSYLKDNNGIEVIFYQSPYEPHIYSIMQNSSGHTMCDYQCRFDPIKIKADFTPHWWQIITGQDI